jgi:hypothetical protein
MASTVFSLVVDALPGARLGRPILTEVASIVLQVANVVAPSRSAGACGFAIDPLVEYGRSALAAPFLRK